MVILGVDPGTLATGIGVVENANGTLRYIGSTIIRNKGSEPMPLRLMKIHRELQRAIEDHHPDQLAIETAFYGKNAQSALKLGHARGVVILTAVMNDLPTGEYSPREVKKAIVGTGAATKDQVRLMVKAILHLKTVPTPYDVTDAIAVAICHAHRAGPGLRTYKSWKGFVASHPERVSPTSQRR